MPFTAIHPAAVLGLARWGLVPSALVVGAITPDLPMLMPIPAVVHFAHTPPGIVTVDLVVGVMVFVLWQALLAPVLIALAPSGVRARLPEKAPAGLAFHFGRLSRVATVLAAIVIGVTTHVVWDSFTHDWMWGPAHIPWLATRHGPLRGFEWVRWVSDAAGLAIVTGWVLLWWRKATLRASPTVIQQPYRMMAWLVILVPAAIGFVYWLVKGNVFLAVTRGAAASLVSLVAVAIAWVLLHPDRTTATSHQADN